MQLTFVYNSKLLLILNYTAWTIKIGVQPNEVYNYEFYIC